MSSYLDETINVYKKAAETPDVGLCCTTSPVWSFPGLDIPKKMLEMNYGCGTTVAPRDLVNEPTVLYIGIGGGMELLQFSYFSRKPKGVIGVDAVPEMLDACRENFETANKTNAWFDPSFIELKYGDALNLPIEDNSVDVVAQNCLFNIFKQEDLNKALSEVYRVLKPHGRLVLSDPICNQMMPEFLKEDEHLRALCLSGSIPLNDYLKAITDMGFGTVEIRAKRPYRILSKNQYPSLEENIIIDSVEICAIKDPMPSDGPCIFTGKAAIYFGNEKSFDDHKGHVLNQNMPLQVCDKTASNLGNLGKDDIMITESTYFYDGGGCC
jgi:ubiquinone/menaquinone biosynthesis C-methylase UbiE